MSYIRDDAYKPCIRQATDTDLLDYLIRSRSIELVLRAKLCRTVCSLQLSYNSTLAQPCRGLTQFHL